MGVIGSRVKASFEWRAIKKKARRREQADGNVVELGGAANTKDVDEIDRACNSKKASAA